MLPEWPPEGPWLLSSRIMSIFAIKSHHYTIKLYTLGHLQISWDVFAKKSADILSFRNSFITRIIISRYDHFNYKFSLEFTKGVCKNGLRIKLYSILTVEQVELPNHEPYVA